MTQKDRRQKLVISSIKVKQLKILDSEIIQKKC